MSSPTTPEDGLSTRLVSVPAVAINTTSAVILCSHDRRRPRGPAGGCFFLPSYPQLLRFCRPRGRFLAQESDLADPLLDHGPGEELGDLAPVLPQDRRLLRLQVLLQSRALGVQKPQELLADALRRDPLRVEAAIEQGDARVLEQQRHVRGRALVRPDGVGDVLRGGGLVVGDHHVEVLKQLLHRVGNTEHPPAPRRGWRGVHDVVSGQSRRQNATARSSSTVDRWLSGQIIHLHWCQTAVILHSLVHLDFVVVLTRACLLDVLCLGVVLQHRPTLEIHLICPSWWLLVFLLNVKFSHERSPQELRKIHGCCSCCSARTTSTRQKPRSAFPRRGLIQLPFLFPPHLVLAVPCDHLEQAAEPEVAPQDLESPANRAEQPLRLLASPVPDQELPGVRGRPVQVVERPRARIFRGEQRQLRGTTQRNRNFFLVGTAARTVFR
mmetsp:Transcript_22671/g.57430  ORF Transcript_22671/g.57430 Transcript_22671/m.57430 type:complete len:439 (-) Transcript_22671:2024-3340(-)